MKIMPALLLLFFLSFSHRSHASDDYSCLTAPINITTGASFLAAAAIGSIQIYRRVMSELKAREYSDATGTCGSTNIIDESIPLVRIHNKYRKLKIMAFASKGCTIILTATAAGALILGIALMTKCLAGNN